MRPAILVVNAGSSSLKFQLFAIEEAGLACLLRAQIDGIGVRPHLRLQDLRESKKTTHDFEISKMQDISAALAEMWRIVQKIQDVQIKAVGHRVVHGGADFSVPVRIDAAVFEKLETLVPLAPLHQPGNLAPIRLLQEMRPDLPQVACFDTAFHRGHPDVADWYALPRSFYVEGVRRYGFHGLSYEYVAEKLYMTYPDLSRGRVIVAHLGSGASMCALDHGQSIESTMGFTAIDGLVMGTRPGHLDPGVVLYLMEQKGMKASEISHLLYRESGLLGLSGISNDMRDLLESSDPAAAFAIDLFAYRCGLQIGQLAAALGGLDAVVFTAGIGENSPQIRARIAARLEWLGGRLDMQANDQSKALISAPTSRIALHIVPTDEELMIARHTYALIRSA